MSIRTNNFAHRDNIYATKEIASVSWYQEYLSQSIEMTNINKRMLILSIMLAIVVPIHFILKPI